MNNEQQAYVDSSGGAVGERRRTDDPPALPRRDSRSAQGRAFDFISGRIDTRSKVTFTYGTAAARMKLAAGAGLWPAFWALGDGRWPDTGEIDIMENVGDPAWTSVGAARSRLFRRHAAGQARAVHRDGPTPRTGTSTPSTGRPTRWSSRWTSARSTASRARWSMPTTWTPSAPAASSP